MAAMCSGFDCEKKGVRVHIDSIFFVLSRKPFLAPNCSFDTSAYFLVDRHKTTMTSMGEYNTLTGFDDDGPEKDYDLHKLQQMVIGMSKVVQGSHTKFCRQAAQLKIQLNGVRTQLKSATNMTKRELLQNNFDRIEASQRIVASKCEDFARKYKLVKDQFLNAKKALKNKNGGSIQERQRVARVEFVSILGMLQQLLALPDGSVAGDVDMAQEIITEVQSISRNQGDQGLNKQAKIYMSTAGATTIEVGSDVEMSQKFYKSLPRNAGPESFKSYNTDQLILTSAFESIRSAVDASKDLQELSLALRSFTPKKQMAIWAAGQYIGRKLWKLQVVSAKKAMGATPDSSNQFDLGGVRRQLMVMYTNILQPLGYQFLPQLQRVPGAPTFAGFCNKYPCNTNDDANWRTGMFRITNVPNAEVRKLTEPATLSDDLGSGVAVGGFGGKPGESALFQSGGINGGGGGFDLNQQQPYRSLPGLDREPMAEKIKMVRKPRKVRVQNVQPDDVKVENWLL
jgi:hypothetical protein